MDVFVNVDKSGRMVVPKWIRKRIHAKRFSVDVEDEKIILIPVKSTREMLGSMPDLNIKGFEREHNKER